MGIIIGLIVMRAIHFLVWAPSSTRAEGLSQQRGAILHMLSYKTKIKVYAPIKYPFLFCRTLSLLASKKPNSGAEILNVGLVYFFLRIHVAAGE
jgi:hypothetical protein